MSEVLLKNLYQYFTDKGYRFCIGKTVEPETKYEIIGKPFVSRRVAIILEKDEEADPTRHADVVECSSLEEIISAGKEIRNELIYFAADCLAEED